MTGTLEALFRVTTDLSRQNEALRQRIAQLEHELEAMAHARDVERALRGK